MNEELLETQIVSLSIERYIREGLSHKEILEKLEDIHLIVITQDDLEMFIEHNLGLKTTKPHKATKTTKTEKYIRGVELE